MCLTRNISKMNHLIGGYDANSFITIKILVASRVTRVFKKIKTHLFQTFDVVLCQQLVCTFLPTIGSASRTPTSIKKSHHPAVQGPGPDSSPGYSMFRSSPANCPISDGSK